MCDSVVMKNIHDGLSSHILNTVGDFWEQIGALMNWSLMTSEFARQLNTASVAKLHSLFV